MSRPASAPPNLLQETVEFSSLLTVPANTLESPTLVNTLTAQPRLGVLWSITRITAHINAPVFAFPSQAIPAHNIQYSFAQQQLFGNLLQPGVTGDTTTVGGNVFRNDRIDDTSVDLVNPLTLRSGEVLTIQTKIVLSAFVANTVTVSAVSAAGFTIPMTHRLVFWGTLIA